MDMEIQKRLPEWWIILKQEVEKDIETKIEPIKEEVVEET